MAVTIGLIFFGLVMIAFFILGAKGWGGSSAADEEHEFCERPRTGKMIKEPVNTWSNLSFVLAGLGILLFLDLSKTLTTPQNPFLSLSLYSILYGCLVIWLGPGSMFLHASLKQWGGWLDNLSMNTYITFIPCYDLTRLYKLNLGYFLLMYAGINIALALITWFWRWQHSGKLLFGLVIGIAVAIEILFNIKGPDRTIGWLIGGVGIFIAAWIIWWFSRNEAPLCKPDSIWQGHAAWHILSAATTVFLFVYFCSEVGAI
ncbi:MAG: ceramidase domain-containing protein [bacterium]